METIVTLVYFDSPHHFLWFLFTTVWLVCGIALVFKKKRTKDIVSLFIFFALFGSILHYGTYVAAIEKTSNGLVKNGLFTKDCIWFNLAMFYLHVSTVVVFLGSWWYRKAVRQ